MFTGGGPEEEEEEDAEVITPKGWRIVDLSAQEAAVVERARRGRDGRLAAARLWDAIVKELQKIPIKWG